MPEDGLEAKLYKLLIYEKGGHFLAHRDSEKHDRMVASLIVVLPNPFQDGSLIVRHGAIKQEFLFKEAAAGKGVCFAAFYADCEHEVKRVTSGIRIALAYNLVLKAEKAAESTKPTAAIDALTEAIQSWMARQPAQPLVFALDHHYTQHGLSLDLFKGADRKLADEVVAAAKHANGNVNLAQVSRHLTNSANDHSTGYGYYNYRNPPRNNKIEIGEKIDDELHGEEWADLDGKKQSWGGVQFNPSAIISTIPLDDWKPTTEEYEGYTGNAGNTLDRWYHRSAIVVWHRDHHYEIITRGNATLCIPEFLSMASRLAKTPKAKQQAVRDECLRFAHALVVNWPVRWSHMEWGAATASPCDEFADSILLLHDQKLIAAFLKVLSERDEVTSLKTFVVAACREFGWEAFERELKLLISPLPNQYGHERMPTPRDFECLAEICCDPSKDPERRILANGLCKLAVDRFCETKPTSYWQPDRSTPTKPEKMLPFLLRALAASDRDEDFARVIQFVRETPKEFSLDFGQVPALKLLIPWSRKHFGSVYPLLQSWFETVRSELEQATAKEPTPPSDWTRPATATCKCNFCMQLNTFLADPKAEVGRITANEDKRRHLISQIEQHRCDIKHSLECSRRPYSLILTKTTGSYDRAVIRYEKDRLLLSELKFLE